MITSIRLRNFRSYRDASFEFEPAINIIVGPNASGKTNLLEAVMVLAGGSSWRARDEALISFKKDWARIDGAFDGHERSLKIEKNSAPTTKTYIIDDHPYRRLNLERTEPVVLFEPDHLDLLSRGPDVRRDFFDDLASRTKPGFKQLASTYRRALAQRNALLKKGPAHTKNQLFVWNIRLSELGSQIASARTELVSGLNHNLNRAYGQIAGRRSISQIVYEAQFDPGQYGSKFLARLEKNIEIDIARGFTTAGPHREDYSFNLNKHNAHSSASRGEVRSLVLALKALELELVEKAYSKKPILLLDDVFSELDGKRRQALVKMLAGHQAILTTTDADAVIAYFDEGHQLIALT